MCTSYDFEGAKKQTSCENVGRALTYMLGEPEGGVADLKAGFRDRKRLSCSGLQQEVAKSL